MRNDLPEIGVIVYLVQNRFHLRAHTELTQILNHRLEFLFTFSFLVISMQSDVLGPVLSKNFHFQECSFCIANGRLVAGFEIHHLFLDKQSLSQPLHILSQQ